MRHVEVVNGVGKNISLIVYDVVEVDGRVEIKVFIQRSDRYLTAKLDVVTAAG